MKLSEFKISISVASYDEKIPDITEIPTLPKSAKLPKYRIYRCKIFKTQIEDLNKDCVEILRPYLLYHPKNRPS